MAPMLPQTTATGGSGHQEHAAHADQVRSDRRRTVLILGSTGSIGTQALDVIAANPDRFEVVGLAAGGGNAAELADQALRYGVRAIAVANATAVEDVQLGLYAQAAKRGYDRGELRLPRIFGGTDAITELIDAVPADVVLNGIDGSRGLQPTLRALATGATLALANKESLVAGGPLVLRSAAPGQLVPVDSEHSALAQCLRGGRVEDVEKLLLTASGGPFRGREKAELANVTVDEALAHPTWSMGPLVTVNSATLMNKGLEVIEAQLLFGLPYERIDVVVHPQSIVHSMVTFADGSTLAQASPPDMRLPISLALGWPDRVAGSATACDFGNAICWMFEPLDHEAFPAVQLCKEAGAAGGCLPAVLNAANECAVRAFLAGNTAFTAIVETVSQVLHEADQWRAEPSTVDEVLAAEQWGRTRCAELLGLGRN
jgi:1-deoxy-D-xylulose-5-phosphate reductoisomerase